MPRRIEPERKAQQRQADGAWTMRSMLPTLISMPISFIRWDWIAWIAKMPTRPRGARRGW